MQTTHKIHFSLAQKMQELADASVDFVLTSPPYPMIEMWDEIMNFVSSLHTTKLGFFK